MDTKTQKIKLEILKQYSSIRKFALSNDIPYTTLKSALDKGIGGTAVETVIKICDILGLDIKTFQPINQSIDENTIDISTPNNHVNCELNPHEIKVISIFNALDKDLQDFALTQLNQLLKLQNNKLKDYDIATISENPLDKPQATEFSNEASIEKELAAYRLELEAEQKGKTFSAYANANTGNVKKAN